MARFERSDDSGDSDFDPRRSEGKGKKNSAKKKKKKKEKRAGASELVLTSSQHDKALINSDHSERLAAHARHNTNRFDICLALHRVSAGQRDLNSARHAATRHSPAAAPRAIIPRCSSTNAAFAGLHPQRHASI